jgi:spore maturation protein CgeB
MSDSSLRIVILGLSITSSWGNGHAATYRGLVRALDERGHRVLFLERDVPWYRAHRDLAEPPYGQTFLYKDLDDLRRRFTAEIRSADLAIVGSYVPEGVKVGEFVLRKARGVTAFYDIDTPVTLAKLGEGDFEYITPELIGEYDMYLSFSGGPTLKRLEDEYGSPMAKPLHCAVDKAEYYPQQIEKKWLMGYLGTYSDDRQPRVESLLNEPARQLSADQFVVAGPSYPASIEWAGNVEQIDHLAPPEHRNFYNSQRFTLNVTRDDMIEAGYSPSVRLFEAAACATPVISDVWEGIETYFTPGEEILLAQSSQQAIEYMEQMSDEECRQIGQRARERVLAEHTPEHRVEQLEQYLEQARSAPSTARTAGAGN